MSNIAYFRYYLSGGAGNTDPNASLGGIRSNTPLIDQETTPATNITGLSILYAHGNGVGNGTLTYVAAGSTLTWSSAGRAAGSSVSVSENGRYVLKDNENGFISVDVTVAALPATDQFDTITVTSPKNMLFDNVSGLEAGTGHTEYRLVYLTWEHPDFACFYISQFIAQQPVGESRIDIGVDPSGVGNGTSTGVATAIPDSTTAPAGVVFLRPDSEANAMTLPALQSGQSIGIWRRRTTPAGVAATTETDGVTIITKAKTHVS